MAGLCRCGRRAEKRGMCNTHYQQWRVATPLKNRQRPTPSERFHAKVKKLGPDQCWPWTDAPNSEGYGVFCIGGRRVGAHRIAYMLATGMLPDCVDHTCHNGSGCSGGRNCLHRRCCNPAHLEDTSLIQNSLRGESVAARHARKTHCVNGHEFNEANTYRPPGRPRRICRACTRARQQATNERKAA